MKHKLFIVLVFLTLLASAFFDTKPTNAASDECLTDAVPGFNIPPRVIREEMPTIVKACDVCNSTFGGALWINDYPGDTADDIKMYTSTSEIIVNGDADIATLYLHGQIYACGISIDASNSGKYDAHYIYITKNPHSGASSATLKDDVVGYVNNQSTLGGASASVDRVLESVTAGSWTKPKRAQAIEINLENYMKVATKVDEYEQIIGGKKYSFQQWEHTVNVYRCPVSTTEISSDGCWSDQSNINLTIRKEVKPNTCLEAHQNDPDYGDTYNGAPSWFTSFGIYYNKCYGESVLGTRVSTKNINESNYTERAILKNSDSTRTATIYVKPGTNVQIDQFYFPAAQLVTKTIADDERLTAKDSSGNAITIPRTASNSVTLSGSGNIDASWTNFKDIGIIDKGAVGNGSVNFTFTRGGYNNAPSFNDSNNTGTVHTGNTITETNSGDSSILGRASVGNLDENGVTNVKKSVESTTVTVIAPYNFTNSVGLSGANFQAGAFAGSEVSFGASYTTNGKNNQWIPGGAYATISPNSKLRLYSFVSDSANPSQNCNPDGDAPAGCETHYYKNGFALNENENPSAAHNTQLYTVSVPDTDAGKYFCVVAAVWPTSSGADDNYTDPDGNKQWEIKKQCTVIQKRAFFQIWGGNVYAKGKVSSATLTKSVVGGSTPASPITFGSWAEHAIVASKKEVTGVASGAALGYTSNNNGNLINSPGGKAKADKNCRFSPITIANTECYTGGSGINDSAVPGNSNIDLSNNVLDLTNYINIAKSTTARTSSSGSPLNLADAYTEKDGKRYTYAVGNLYLSSSSVLPAGVTQIVYATGSIEIDSNLRYEDSLYSNPSSVPQLIIIAGGNINIKENVTNIDAWLYTKTGTIDTCPKSSSSPDCGNPLRINGPVVAGKMVLDRNYGGGTGNDSGTPAEIINLTPATYLFSQAKSTENTSLRVVYSKEIAPRY